MNICIFLGPTLPAKAAAEVLDAVYLPPAAQGDVYQAANDGAEVIGIVDGCFQGAPSVWHKEILWAMSQGIHVLGCSSMGALRAAELAAFGMRGVGRIFEAYRDGVISDDDEVALVHGPEEMHYRSRTVPLVNIRASLARALDQAVITENAHGALLEAARSLFYWDRTYDALIEKCKVAVDGQALDGFSRWVSEHGVDQKRDDAIEMLELIRELPAEPLQVAYQFQRTNAWDDLVEEVRLRAGEGFHACSSEGPERVLDELRLEPRLYRRIAAASPAPRRALNLPGPDRDPLIAALMDSGHYGQLAARAADKTRVLSAAYADMPEYADAMMSPSDVLQWYFEDTCASAVPTDLARYAEELGLSSSGELCRLLLRELLYELARDEEQVNRVPL